MTTCIMRFGDTEIPLDGVTWDRVKLGEQPAPTSHRLEFTGASSFEVTCDVPMLAFDMAAFREMFVLPERPQHTLTVTRKTRNGATITETFDDVEVCVVIARRGLKRPGQWTDATRAKRHKRLARAAERRAGISRRGLRRGFPMRSFALGPIHAEYKARITREQASAVEHAVNEDLRARFGEQAPTLRYEDAPPSLDDPYPWERP